MLTFYESPTSFAVDGFSDTRLETVVKPKLLLRNLDFYWNCWLSFVSVQVPDGGPFDVRD